jgi:hypothetical protein
VQITNNSANLKLIKIANGIYLGAAFAYVFYSWMMENGLCGYLMDLQLRYFDVAYQKFTLVMAIGILAVPSAVVSSFLKRQELLAGIIPSNFRTWQMTSWNQVLIWGLAPAAIAMPAYYVLMEMDRKDQQREIFKVDLNRGSALPAGDVKFVELTGIVQLDHRYQLKKERRRGSDDAKTYTYAPLTGSDWTQGQPIRFFVNATSTGYTDPKTKLPRNFPEQGVVAATFDGQLVRNGLPTYVENEFRRGGLLIESEYFVLDRKSFYNGRVPSRSEYYLIPYFGIGLSGILLVAFSLGLVVNKNRLKRAG